MMIKESTDLLNSLLGNKSTSRLLSSCKYEKFYEKYTKRMVLLKQLKI